MVAQVIQRAAVEHGQAGVQQVAAEGREVARGGARRAAAQRAAPVELSTEIEFAGENTTQQLRLADKRYSGVPGRNVTSNPL